jgi:hypothetical protein
VLTALAFWSSIVSPALLTATFSVAGLYVAVQALESTITAGLVSPDTLAISYCVLGIVNGGTPFLPSAVIEVLWTDVSPVVGFGLVAGLTFFGSIALRRLGR